MIRNSLVIRFDGQAGDGVLSIGQVLAKAAASTGYHVLTQSFFSSEVRGGESTFQVRLGCSPILSPGENPDVVIALDSAGAKKHAPVLAADGLIMHPPGNDAATLGLSELQESRCLDWKAVALAAGSTARSQNMVAAGFAAALVGLDRSVIEAIVAKRFARDPEVAAANVRAAVAGFESVSRVLNGSGLAHQLGPAQDQPLMLMSGNEAVALGALVADVRFFAGYPITPASEIMEMMAKHLPNVGGKYIQAEDEIASLAMCLGASFGGPTSMTATSGPGLALMCELLSLSGMAEVPVVIVDVQRAGPSTGMPTKDGQADLSIAVYGTHGEAPRVVLAAQTVADCFHQMIRAVNIAQKHHVPVILLSSQAISHSQETVELPNLDRLPTYEETFYPGPQAGEFKRYGNTEDGQASIRSRPGTPGGTYRTTGLEHDQLGQPCSEPANRVRMMERRAQRMLAIAHEQCPLEQPEIHPEETPHFGLVGWGRAASTAREAWFALRIDGHKLAAFFPHLLWPLPEAGFKQMFAAGVHTLYVCETNSSGQFAQLIRAQLASQLVAYAVEVVEITKDDGTPLTQHEIHDRVLEHMTRHAKRKTAGAHETSESHMQVATDKMSVPY
jgi:2-oxoglutarate/2-oxoacid ferredoxin oxidoreductase subunit alpha